MSEQKQLQIPQEIAQQVQLLQARLQAVQLAQSDLASAIALVLQASIEAINTKKEFTVEKIN